MCYTFYRGDNMLKKESELKNRSHYLEKLIEFKDTDFVKIITGIRRCGKSSLMKLMIKHLLENEVEKEQIIQINFESIEFKKMTVENLYNYVKSNLPRDKKAYLFFDEIQKISEWQDAINSFRVDFECDIYITGSNAFLLSSEYATYLAGRSVEIKVFPLSFIEFIDFHGYKIIEKKNLRWNLALNAAYNKNTVVKLPHNGYPNNRQNAIEAYNPTTGKKEWVGGYQEGQEPGDMYAHEALGIYQNEEQVRQLANNLVDETGSKKLYGPAAWARLSDAEKEKGLPIQPGDVIWRDVNGDGKIDNYDLVKAGNIYPKWTGGINTTLSYKNIRLSARMDYALNFKQRISIGNSLPWYLGNMQGTFNTVKQVNDTWTPDNPTAKYPKYYWADQLGKRNYYRSSTMFIYEGSYLAFREIALSYNFQKDIVSKMGLDNLELSLIGQNLGYLTKAETYSPEALGQSNSGYPLPRTIILGLNLTF